MCEMYIGYRGLVCDPLRERLVVGVGARYICETTHLLNYCVRVLGNVRTIRVFHSARLGN